MPALSVTPTGNPLDLDPLVKPAKLMLAIIIDNILCYLVGDFDMPQADVWEAKEKWNLRQ